MKGQNVDFSTTIQGKKQSSTKDKKTTRLPGELINFSVNTSKKDTLDKRSNLSGKYLDFSITVAGKWSIVEQKPTSCMICKLPFKETQKISRCPMCHSLFHADHIFEWLKVKGKCPVCLQNLRPGGTEEVKL
jgi:hypothetical protein